MSMHCTESYALSMYSHLSNKRDVTLTDFEKFHPTQNKNPPYTFIDFLDLFHPPLLDYCIYVLLVFSKTFHLQHLFQIPRLLILHLFHVYSNLLGY